MNLRALWDGPPGRTWLNHAILAVVYTLVAAVLLKALPQWAWPAAFPMFYYGIREVEGMLYTGRLGSAFEITDHVFDVVSPTAAALLTARLLQVFT